MKRLAVVLIGVGLLSSCSKKTDDPVVAELNGEKIRESAALAAIKNRLFDLEEEVYQLKENAINEYIDQQLLEAEAKKQNLPVAALMEKMVGGDPAEVTDAEINEFLSSKGLSLSDNRIKKDDVRDYLKFRKTHEKQKAYVSQLRAAAKIRMLVEPPQLPMVEVATTGYPAWGNSTAPVTLVEFSNYQCGWCKRVVTTIKELKEKYGPDKLRVVYRDMPGREGSPSAQAALAALCANDQGKFLEYHEVLFENQHQLDDKNLGEFAKKLSLDTGKFDACLKNKTHKGLLEATQREADGVGITGTPTFVINGNVVHGAVPLEKFQEKIDAALKKKS